MTCEAVLKNDRVSVVASESPEKLETGAAQFLAYFAAAPLLASALYIVGAGAAPAAMNFMALYGAALIIFFGGVRWGVAVMRPEGPSMRALLGAVLPLAIALPLFLPLSLTYKFAAIMVVVGLLLLDDLQATRRGSGAPGWYLAVRLPLTVLIELAFLIAFVGEGK
ncbi:MAG: DUF3429 domain-containing protein [Marinicaulis sp.]|nr:DUF3429 domain-containing protein [Marinicaulis sp.]